MKYHCSHFGGCCSSAVTWELPGLNKFQTKCVACELHGPITNTYEEAHKAFWKMDNERKIGDIMSTEDYKRGVEDATKLLTYDEWKEVLNHPEASKPSANAPDLARIAQELRRKKLLTKKVTKWVRVYVHNATGEPSPGSIFYDSQSAALNNTTAPIHSAVPVEIELPL